MEAQATLLLMTWSNAALFYLEQFLQLHTMPFWWEMVSLCVVFLWCSCTEFEAKIFIQVGMRFYSRQYETNSAIKHPTVHEALPSSGGLLSPKMEYSIRIPRILISCVWELLAAHIWHTKTYTHTQTSLSKKQIFVFKILVKPESH